jgi:PIN domain nuclease of toxin-antitoxin system
MNNCVLDASALLALINSEPGAERVEGVLANAILSSVNFAEIAAILMATGIPSPQIHAMISELVAEIVPFDEEQAILSAMLRAQTKQYGLSLGDRACLALGIFKNLPVLTADKAWGELDLKVPIVLIR